MGGGTYSPSSWDSYAKKTSTKSTQQIFTSYGIDPDLDPRNIKIRESRDTPTKDPSTPIMAFLDVTGSMGDMARVIAQKGLGTIMGEIISRNVVTDPQILFGAIGDIFTDQAPLQATQFEVEVDLMTPQLEKIYLEGNGGGNGGESYDLAWLFAALKTSTDSWEKRQKKGALFTIGDEPPPHGLSPDLVRDKTGLIIEKELKPAEVLAMAERTWDCYHIFLQQGGYGQSLPRWKQLMPERVIVAPDYEKLGELIVSVLQARAGVDIDTVANSWSGDTSVVVRNALKDLAVPGGGGVGLAPVRF